MDINIFIIWGRQRKVGLDKPFLFGVLFKTVWEEGQVMRMTFLFIQIIGNNSLKMLMPIVF